MKRWLRGLAAALFLMALWAPDAASAHAGLIGSSPSPSAVLEESPPVIELRFDESVEVSLSSITLFNQDSVPIALGAPQQGADSSIVTASVPPLDDGLYAVIWRVSSADGHVVDGALSFQVGTSVTPAVDGATLIDGVRNGVHSSQAVRRSLGVARAAAYLGAALLLGGLFMLLTADVGTQHGWATRRVLWFGWSLLVVSAGAGFGLLGANALGGTVGDVFDTSVWGDIAGTRTGTLLLVRLIVLMMFVPVLLVINRPPTTWWPVAVPMAGLLLVFSFSGGGHPSVSDPAALWMSVDALHFGFVTLWLGGLAMMAIGGNVWLQGAQHTPAVMAFSKMSTIGVPIIIGTGIAQTWRLSGGISTLTETSWGRVLLAKSVIAVFVVTIGGVSRWLLHADGPASLRRTVTAEALLALGVVGLAAGLVSLPPQATAKSQLFSVALTQAGTTADINLSPGVVGANEVHIVVTPAGGNLKPIVGMTARMSLPAAGVSNLAVTIEAIGPNHYQGTVSLPFSGDWVLELVIAPTANESVLMSTTVPIP